MRGEEEELSERVERLIQEEKECFTSRNSYKISLKDKLGRLLEDVR